MINTPPSSRPRISLRVPGPSETITVSDFKNAVVALEFDPSVVRVALVKGALILFFPNGGTIVFLGFVEITIGDAPRFELPGGETLTTPEFFTEYTALLRDTGPQTVLDSGIGEYMDDPGQLIGDIDRLGWLGTIYWSRETKVPEIWEGYWYEDDGGSDGPPDIVIPGTLSTVFIMFEDGQPDQYKLADLEDPATGSRDNTYEAGYDPVTGKGFTLQLDGAAPEVTVLTITIGELPPASQGVIFYNGQPVQAGQTIASPDLAGFSFRPADNFSGDVHFSFSYRLTSPSTGPATNESQGTAVLRVDSVADLPDAESRPTGRTEDGDVLDMPDAVIQDDGWAVQSIQSEDTLAVTFSVTATFTDLDGSERAWVDVLLPQGFSVPAGMEHELIRETSGTFARFPIADLETLRSANGVVELPLTLVMDKSAAVDGTGNSLTIRTVTQEKDSWSDNGYTTDNNSAVRVIAQDVPVHLFPDLLTVKAGWAYEGNKAGGEATEDIGTLGLDAASTAASGAPIQFDVVGGGNIDSVTITVPAGSGTLYLGSTSLGSGPDYTITGDQLRSGMLFFRPASGYSDADVPEISFEVTMHDANNTVFVVTGKTEIVIDAVADKGVIVGDPGVAVAGDNSTLDITVTTAFPDTDGSERHYILVEKLDRWDCPDATDIITVYYDSEGNPLQPAATVGGEYGYDLSKMSYSKVYFRIDVTEESKQAGGAEYAYTVRVVPDPNASDITISTGTMAEERIAGLDGREYDVANNVAFDLADTFVNFVDTAESITATPVYEDHNPTQNQGTGTEIATDGIITVKLTPTGDFVDNSAGKFVEITFTYDGAGEPGSFEYNGILANAARVSGNTWTLRAPTSSVPGDLTEFSFRYHPNKDDDTDLKNLTVKVPVRAEGTGLEGEVEATLDTLVVDAVADKPTGVTGAVTISGGHAAAESGGEVTLEVQARFGDYTDGSEQHYLVFDLNSGLSGISGFPPEWTLLGTAQERADAGLESYADTSRYVIVKVPNSYLQDPARLGKVDVPLTATLDDVSKDGNLTLNFTAVAVDTPSDLDITANNNHAATPGSVTVPVHTVTSDPVLHIAVAYENDLRLDHISGGGHDGGALSVTGIDASEQLTSMTIRFESSAGSLAYSGLNGGLALSPGDYALANGNTLTIAQQGSQYTITVGGGTNVAAEVAKLRFTPAENNSDQDVPLTYECTVVDTASGMEKDFPAKDASVIVDAVAQQPENAQTEILYDPGTTAAYDHITVKASADFRDVTDGSEKHYLLIEVKGYMDTTALDVITVGFDASGNPLTPAASGSGLLNPDPSSKTDMGQTATTTQDFIRIPVDGVIEEFRQFGTVPDGFTVTDNQDGTYTVAYTGRVAVDLDKVPRDIADDPVWTGGMAVESATPGNGDAEGGREGYEYNNAGFQFSSDTVDIAVVETVAVTVLMGKGYEHNSPAANEGVLNTGTGAGLLAVRTLPADGSGADEEVTVTFTYDALYRDGDGNWVLPGDIVYNGHPENVTQTVDPATGKVTVQVLLDPADASSMIDSGSLATDQAGRDAQTNASAIRFVPNESSYNEADVNINYTVTVEDGKSGAAEQKGGGTGIVVIDAVADRPVIDPGSIRWEYADPSYTASASQDVTLTFSVTFPDTGANGVVSEGQYILVQQMTGMDLSQAFKDALAASGGGVVTYPEGGQLYYRIPTSFFTQTSPGVYAVEIPMRVQSGLSDLENFTTPAVIAQAVVNNIHGGEITLDNNTAEQPVTLPDLNFAVVDTYVANGSVDLYEGNNSRADIGQYTYQDAPVPFDLGIRQGNSLGGAVEEIGPIKVTYAQNRGQLYLNDGSSPPTRVNTGDAITYEQSKNLFFIPGDSRDNTADLDVNIAFSFTATDPASGAEKTLTGDFAVIIDAVAVQPSNMTVTGFTINDTNGNGTISHGESVSFTANAQFPDYDKSGDNHADHYILVQKPGAYWTTNYPDAEDYTLNGVSYFKIPVSPSAAPGDVALPITLYAPPSGYLLYDNSQPINIVAMTVDRDPNNGPLPPGDQEVTYDNNWAYKFADPPLTMNYDPDAYNYFSVGALYEDNTPLGNELNANGTPNTTKDGGKVTLPTTVDPGGGAPTETVTQVELTWDPSKGSLWVGTTEYTGGSVTLTPDQFGDVRFQVPDGTYDDTDFGQVTARVTTDQGEHTYTTSPIVDAVAQVPTNVSSTPDYEGASTATPPGQNVSITVSADFTDTDGSENHYVLVEVVPGWGNPMGYPTIYAPDGSAYYQVPVDPTQSHVDQEVILTAPSSGGTDQGDGKTGFTLKTGAMSEEDMTKSEVNGAPRGEEVRDDNNTAYNLGHTVEIVTSSAESNPALNATDAFAGSDRDGDGTPDSGDSSNLFITGLDADSDNIPQVELTYPNAHGSIQFRGTPLQDLNNPDVVVTDNGNGTSSVVITDPAIIAALSAGNAGESDVKYVPTDYNADDLRISATVTVRDNFSTDSKQVGSSSDIIVDAVAQKPTTGTVVISDPDVAGGNVQGGASVPFAITGSFPDKNGAGADTHHYLGLEQVDGWTVDGPCPPG